MGSTAASKSSTEIGPAPHKKPNWFVSHLFAFIHAATYHAGRLFFAGMMTAILSAFGLGREAIRYFLVALLEGGNRLLSNTVSACAAIVAWLVQAGLYAGVVFLACCAELLNVVKLMLFVPACVIVEYSYFLGECFCKLVVGLIYECINACQFVWAVLCGLCHAAVCLGINVVIIAFGLFVEICASLLAAFVFVVNFSFNAFCFIVSHVMEFARGAIAAMSVALRQIAALMVAAVAGFVCSIWFIFVTLSLSAAAEVANIAIFTICAVPMMVTAAWEICVALPIALIVAFFGVFAGNGLNLTKFRELFTKIFHLVACDGLSNDTSIFSSALWDKHKDSLEFFTCDWTFYPGNAASFFYEQLNPQPISQVRQIFGRVGGDQPLSTQYQQISDSFVSYGLQRWQVWLRASDSAKAVYAWFQPESTSPDSWIVVMRVRHNCIKLTKIKTDSQSFANACSGGLQPPSHWLVKWVDLFPDRPRGPWNLYTSHAQWCDATVPPGSSAASTYSEYCPEQSPSQYASEMFHHVRQYFAAPNAWYNTVNSDPYVGGETWFAKDNVVSRCFNYLAGVDKTIGIRDNFDQSYDWALAGADEALSKTGPFITGVIFWPLQVIPVAVISTGRGFVEGGVPGAFFAFVYSFVYLNFCVPFPFRYAYNVPYQDNTGSRISWYKAPFHVAGRDIDTAVEAYKRFAEAIGFWWQGGISFAEIFFAEPVDGNSTGDSTRNALLGLGGTDNGACHSHQEEDFNGIHSDASDDSATAAAPAPAAAPAAPAAPPVAAPA